MDPEFLSTILKLGPALYSDFSGGTSAPYLQNQKQIAQQQQQIYGELQNPNSAGYQQLYNQYKDQNTQNLAQGISELQGQNRMAAGMGRTPLFSQDRGGETLFRGLTQGYQNAGNQATQQTNQSLMNQLNGGNTAMGNYSTLSGYGAKANEQQLSGFDTLAKFLSPGQNAQTQQMPSQNSTFGNGYYNTLNNQGTQNIKWNSPSTNQYTAGGGYNMGGWQGN